MAESHSVATPARFAATDMLHRRIPLAHVFELELGESTIRIKTDFSLIGEALRELVWNSRSIRGFGVAKWEIAVEVQNEAAPLTAAAGEERCETCSFGPSRSVRMHTGSWFAHTPPSMNGVGFAMIAGSEHRQVQQLAAYLRTILHFLASGATPFNSCVEREVKA